MRKLSRLSIAQLLLCFCMIMMLVTCKKSEKTHDPYDNSFVPANPPAYGLERPSSEEYKKIPAAPNLVGAPGSLPGSKLLEIPTIPFNQGSQGSCVSCASAMAKSIMDHLALKTNYVNNNIIYSPSYLYVQAISNPGVCGSGSGFIENLEIMKNKGICEISDMPYSEFVCAGTPTQSQDQLAAHHKIANYYILRLNRTMIKQYINQGQPVIVGITVDDNIASAYWNPAKRSVPWSKFGTSQQVSHATLLYGWDDTKNAFRMLNQWGSGWGDNGSIWVDYDMVENPNVFFAAIVIQNPAIDTNQGTVDLSGDLNFGSISVNTSLTKQLKITNNTNSTVTISSLTINQPFSADWTGGAIPPGTSKSVYVTFKPISAANFNETVSVNYNGLHATATATGTGLPVAAATKIISLSGDLNFGNVNVGQSASLSFSISNQGNTTLNVSSLSMPGGFSGNFSGQIPANTSTGIPISFTPGSSGQFQGRLVVNSDATSGSNSVNITGSGMGTSSGPTGIPAIGSFGNCIPPRQNPNCSNFGDGIIKARVVSVNTATKQIVFEIAKCDGSRFETAGYINAVSSLCDVGPVIYGTQQFVKGSTTAQIICTDASMTGNKTYYVYTYQMVGTNQYFYDAAPLVIRY